MPSAILSRYYTQHIAAREAFAAERAEAVRDALRAHLTDDAAELVAAASLPSSRDLWRYAPGPVEMRVSCGPLEIRRRDVAGDVLVLGAAPCAAAQRRSAAVVVYRLTLAPNTVIAEGALHAPPVDGRSFINYFGPALPDDDAALRAEEREQLRVFVVWYGEQLRVRITVCPSPNPTEGFDYVEELLDWEEDLTASYGAAGGAAPRRRKLLDFSGMDNGHLRLELWWRPKGAD